MKKTRLQKWNRQMAERIAKRLFTGGDGQVVSRLVMETQGNKHLGMSKASGWCVEAVADQVEDELNS